MAFYLVKAKPEKSLINELENELKKNRFIDLKSFGKALTYGLKNAKKYDSDFFIWEEEDYCSPPLKEEKEAVLDKYFKSIEVTKVNLNDGWKKIANLPDAFPYK